MQTKIAKIDYFIKNLSSHTVSAIVFKLSQSNIYKIIKNRTVGIKKKKE